AAQTLFRSEHSGFSYGQNLTTTNITGLSWSFRGQSHCLYLNANAFERMFAGLTISLTGAFGSVTAVVTGVYKTDVYATCRVAGTLVLPGTKSVTYTGTTIGQEAYKIVAVGSRLESKTVATLPTASAYTGVGFLVTDANATTFWSIVAGGGSNTV